MVDNCNDTIAIEVCIITPLKSIKKSKIHLPKTINHQYQETKYQETKYQEPFYITHLQLFTF